MAIMRAGSSLRDTPCHGDGRFRSRCQGGRLLRAGGFDVVNVTVPNYLHAQFTVAALEAGSQVFAEKPLGLTLAECDAVIDAERRTGRLVALDHELRVSKQWGAVRDLVASGDIGKVRHQHLSLFRHAFRQGSGGWRYDAQKVGSWILEELVHFFDLVLWYAAENGAPSRVCAYGNGRSDALADNFVATLEWADGSTAVLSQCLAGFEHHSLLEIAGTEGAVRTWWSGALDRTLTPTFELKAKRARGQVEVVSVPKSGEVFELEENLRRAYAGFASGVSILPPREARASIAVCLAAEEAYRTKRAVALR
ncbi:MAG: Gfo/Idh/MocA family oxidoreductase [Chloroflexi bacterium]|nr:Gfo/Idh/MocA family oxidoreductase [Chloroflexota bacterium]